jgi:hypothetical protein
MLGSDTVIGSGTGGTLTLNGSFTGNSHNVTFDGAGAIVVNPNAYDVGTVNLTGTGNRTFNGALGQSNAINISNSGNNAFNGVVSGSTLSINGSSNNTFNSTVNFSNGVITIASPGSQSFAGTINSSGMNITGGGTVFLGGNGTNAINGATTMTGGTLILGKTGGAQALTHNLTVTNGDIELAGNNQVQQSNQVAITLVNSVFNFNNYSNGVDSTIMTNSTINTGTGVLNITDTGGNAIIANASNVASVINGTVALSGSAPAIDVEQGTAAVGLIMNATITSTGQIVKNGDGVLQINKSVSTGGTNDRYNHQIEINAGTLLLGASNVIVAGTAITLNGGTLNTGGFSDKVGLLTLNANSTIDMGKGASILTFDYDSQSSTKGASLTVKNWSGNATTGGGTDQIIFDGTTPDATFLADVYWADYGTYGSRMIGNELVPILPIVPEPDTIAAGGLLVGWMVWRKRNWLRYFTLFRPS